LIVYWWQSIKTDFQNKKKTDDEWNQKYIDFYTLLYHFNLSYSIILEINISNYIDRDIISQYDNKRILYSYIFFNWKFMIIKFNYEIYNKKIFIIIDYFIIW